MLLSQLAAWQELKKQQERLQSVKLAELFANNPHRSEQLTVEACGLTLDFSRNFFDEQAFNQLLQLVTESALFEKVEQVFSGEIWNNTENRAVLHSALRSSKRSSKKSVPQQEVQQALKLMRSFVDKVHQGEWKGHSGKVITDIVNIGIGGSDLGPAMVCQALYPYKKKSLDCHFISNIDAFDINKVLAEVNPETTLFIVASKSFTTLETLTNANTAREWFLSHATEKDIAKHFIAVSSNIEKAQAFGIEKSNIFPMWDWVGGRFSLWSAIGLPIALATSMEIFEKLLAGAEAMDEHFRNSPAEKNLPVILALLEIWYTNFWGAQSHAILPYDESLNQLPAYLQQLIMESNGKLVSRDGETINYNTSPIIWGAAGTNGQHSFHQLLHQGTHLVPCDFIVPLQSHFAQQNHHQHLVANAFAQITALTYGRSLEEALDEVSDLPEDQAAFLAKHKYIPGNRPSNVLMFVKLTPEILSALIALYENKVLASSIFWGINAFDQWGVELGKTISTKIHQSLVDPDKLKEFDTATQSLIKHYHDAN